MLQGKDHGASTKNILKYLEDKLNDEMNGVKILPSPADGVVKSALGRLWVLVYLFITVGLV